MREINYLNVRVNNKSVCDSIRIRARDSDPYDILDECIHSISYESSTVKETKSCDPALNTFKYIAILRNVHSYVVDGLKIEIRGRTEEDLMNKISMILGTVHNVCVDMY